MAAAAPPAPTVAATAPVVASAPAAARSRVVAAPPPRDVGVVVAALVAAQLRHVLHVGVVYADALVRAAQREPAHLVDGGAGGVDTLVLDGGVRVALLVLHAAHHAEPVELPLQ